jgi:hypothetical protein
MLNECPRVKCCTLFPGEPVPFTRGYMRAALLAGTASHRGCAGALPRGRARCGEPPLFPLRTNWTHLVPPLVLSGHVLSLPLP